MKKLIIIPLLLLTGCNIPVKQCYYIARDLEDHLYFTEDCRIDKDTKEMYCMIDNEKVIVYEIEYMCEVEYE